MNITELWNQITLDENICFYLGVKKLEKTSENLEIYRKKFKNVEEIMDAISEQWRKIKNDKRKK
jgi:hypothetical protein